MSKICKGCMKPYEDEFNICPLCGYLSNSYIVGNNISISDGLGGFTYIGWDAVLKQKVYIKEYKKNLLPKLFSIAINHNLDMILEEAHFLIKFNKLEGINKFFDSFILNDAVYIIMEYLEGETLADHLKREVILPDEAIAMLMPIIKSLQIMHEQGIIHGDISPNNIFLTNDGRVIK